MEKNGTNANYTIEKRLFWIHSHGKTFLEMCFKNESKHFNLDDNFETKHKKSFKKVGVSETL